MANFDFSNLSTTVKVLPFAGLLAGLGFAHYKKVKCVKCYIIAGAGGFAIGSLPLLHEAHEAFEAKAKLASVTVASTATPTATTTTTTTTTPAQ